MRFLKPLAELIRPQSMDELIGQKRLLQEKGPLYQSIMKDELHSFILWGPPGSGKTSLAHVIQRHTNHIFHSLNAVTCGVKEIRTIADDAKKQKMFQKKTILFIDEIHHFNKKQQNAFLPLVENGDIILIGTTTENPSFELTRPLLSRMKIYVLEPLLKEDIEKILERGHAYCKKQFAPNLETKQAVFEHIAAMMGGDSRAALNFLEMLIQYTLDNSEGDPVITLEILETLPIEKFHQYDKTGEEHYNLISAFHKSLRGSDVEAAVYWATRMLESGEKAHYILRRLTVVATEDVGLADPQALVIANAARQAFDFLGPPEGYQSIIQATIYIASAPKSNSVYKSMHSARDFVNNNPGHGVPLHLRNAPTKLMKKLNYGTEYKYPHDFPNHFVKQQYLPEEIVKIKNSKFYTPGQFGFEKEIKKRLSWWEKKKSK